MVGFELILGFYKKDKELKKKGLTNEKIHVTMILISERR
jgi:hypothetical protein